MSVPAYESYRESGVPWLGQVPRHWVTTKTKHACRYTTGWTPPTGRDEYYGDEFPWANISDLGSRTLLDTAKGVTKKAIADSGAELSPKGSLLFSFKLSVGQVSFAGRDLYTNEAIATFHKVNKFCLEFAYYALPIFLLKNASENIYGAKLLNQQLIGNAPLCLPPPDEQTVIAAFLDRETGKIDALVEEQKRLIELLKEKRQAVISHAVTKGLDPTAPMKDSGVEWLGEVPAHWAVTKVKHVIRIATSGPRGWSDLLGDEGGLFFQSQNIDRCMDIVLDDAKKIIPPADSDALRARLRTDDVVVCITGARTGAVAHVKHLIEEAYINQHVCLLRPNQQKIQGRFLAYCLHSFPGQEQLAAAMYGLKQGMGLDQVRTQTIAHPSIQEQAEIVKQIDILISAIDGLSLEADAAIALLMERRTALISAAVTGKIDVRRIADKTLAAA